MSLCKMFAIPFNLSLDKDVIVCLMFNNVTGEGVAGRWRNNLFDGNRTLC